jgi:hypothetical protein
MSELIIRRVPAMRAEGRASLPGTFGAGIDTKPFLRADRPALQHAAGARGDAVPFAAIRRRKDDFRAIPAKDQESNP